MDPLLVYLAGSIAAVGLGVVTAAAIVVKSLHGAPGGKRLCRWAVLRLTDMDKHSALWHWYAREHGWKLTRRGGSMGGLGGAWGFTPIRPGSAEAAERFGGTRILITPAPRPMPYPLTDDPLGL